MSSVKGRYWVALVVAILLGWATESVADTRVHGYTIPTVGGELIPNISICGPLASGPIDGGIQGRLADRRHTGTDSRSYSAMYCFPVAAEDGPREFVVPPAVVAAIAIVEHSLSAYFEHDSFSFDDLGAIAALDVIVSWVVITPDARLRLSGHTDATGSLAYNLGLSFRRVEAVKAILVKKGVPEGRIVTEWFGETSLLLNVLGREPSNRRVLIEVFQMREMASE